MATYKYETITEYDKFKIELRKIETVMKEEHDTEKRPCKPAVCAEKPVKSEMGEVMELLKNKYQSWKNEFKNRSVLGQQK